MGNFCGCTLSSDGSSCSTAMGNCANRHCQSSCMQEVRAVEEIVDVAMKKYIAEHLHPILEEKVGAILALQIESTMIKMTDIALLPNSSSSSSDQTLVNMSTTTTEGQTLVNANAPPDQKEKV